MFPYEAWHDLEPWKLAMAIVPWTVLAAAWLAALPPGLGSALRLAGLLLAVDIALDLASPFPRRFTLLPWELVRLAALGLATALAPWLATRSKRAARGLRIASAVFAAHIPIAMIGIAIVGSRDRAAPADAALVLGFALAPDGSPRPQLVARVEHAVSLYRRGLVPRLILSGGVARGGKTEAIVMRDLALAAGVPADAIVLEQDSRSTIENFACAGPLTRSLGVSRVLLVTEPWHMTRALLLARRHGLDLRPSPASSPVWRSVRDATFWLYRDANAFVREAARQPFAAPATCRAATCDGCRKM